MTTVEHDIVAQVYAAKEDSDAADQFIQQYLPFIRSETAKFRGRCPGPPLRGRTEHCHAGFYEAILGYARTRAFLPMRPGPSKTGSSIIPGRRNATRTWFPSTPLRGGGTDVRGHPSRPKRPDGGIRPAAGQPAGDPGVWRTTGTVRPHLLPSGGQQPQAGTDLTACHRVLTTPGRPPAVGPLSGDPAPPHQGAVPGRWGGQKDPRTTPSLFGGHPPGLHQRL